MKKVAFVIIAGGLLSACSPFHHAKHKFHHTINAINDLRQETGDDRKSATGPADEINRPNKAQDLKQAKRLRLDGFSYRAVEKLMPHAAADNSAPFAIEYAKTLISLNQAKQAENYLLALQDSDIKNTPGIKHMLGIAQASQGKLTDAEQTLRRAMNGADDDLKPVIANNLALVLAQLKQLEEADLLSDHAMQSDPMRPDFARTVHLIDRLQGMEVVQNTIAPPPPPVKENAKNVVNDQKPVDQPTKKVLEKEKPDAEPGKKKLDTKRPAMMAKEKSERNEPIEKPAKTMLEKNNSDTSSIEASNNKEKPSSEPIEKPGLIKGGERIPDPKQIP
jgi:tetratricopeptide (TPR) repeat protein